MQANVMNDRGTDAMKTHLSGCEMLEYRQVRRGCVQECLGCEALTEVKYLIGGQQVFHSLEETDCLCRMFCTPIHPFKMVVKELNTDSEIITVDRPLHCPLAPCKCCSYQEAIITSGGNDLGKIEEQCYYCIPTMKVFDHTGAEVYLVHPPTCLGGLCINCCAEGNPCGKGCCKESFRIYAPNENNDGGNSDAPYLGVILKKPKSAMTEIVSDAIALDVKFPTSAASNHKGLLTGLAIFINSAIYQGAE
jgi:hypothetical protein